jgi:hypothetical protein
MVMLPHELPIPEDALALWVIYDHPRDYPDYYVLRPQIVAGAKVVTSTVAWTSKSVEALREVMEDMGLHCMPRQDDDDPVIVETWI